MMYKLSKILYWLANKAQPKISMTESTFVKRINGSCIIPDKHNEPAITFLIQFSEPISLHKVLSNLEATSSPVTYELPGMQIKSFTGKAFAE